VAGAVGPTSGHAQVVRDRVVRALKWKGNKHISTTTLENSIATTNSSWFARQAPFSWLGFLGEKRYLNETDLERDVLRVGVLYKLSGFPDVQVDTVVRRTADDAWITFVITEGDPIRVDTLIVTGLDSLPERLRKAATIDLPLPAGRHLQSRLHARRRRHDHPPTPGPRLSVGRGVRELQQPARGQDGAGHAECGAGGAGGRRHGPRGREPAGGLGVDRPPDGGAAGAALLAGRSLRQPAQSVQLRPLPPGVGQHRHDEVPGGDGFGPAARAGDGKPTVPGPGRLGYGTSDCVRATGGFTVRNFLGHARLFDITGGVSKVGTGAPLDWGFERGICGALRDDSIGSRRLNYSLATSIRRPAFRSPNNTLI
jgi:Outer membrane protein/protective antigen OMA87